MSTATPGLLPDTDPLPHVAVQRSTPFVVPVIEESLVVGKRRVDRGGWRITKRVNVRDEQVEEALRSEEVEVVRRPVGELLASLVPPLPRQEGDTWIVPVVEEVLVTEKRLLLKEEIRITRTDSTRRHTEQVSLRSEDVSIERLEPGTSPSIVSP